MEPLLVSPEEAPRLLSRASALQHRVLPIMDDGAALHLASAKLMTSEERAKQELILEFVLGRTVRVHSVEKYPELEFNFDGVLDELYPTPFETTFTEPVSTDFASVLLVVADKALRTKYRTRLEGVGFIVTEVPDVEAAATALKDPCRKFYRIVIERGDRTARSQLYRFKVTIQTVEDLLNEFNAELGTGVGSEPFGPGGVHR